MDEEIKKEIPLEEPVVDQQAKERDEYLAGWQRAKADLANYKKEEGERLKLMSRFQLEAVCHELLPVLDSFELGLQSSGDKQGLEMIRNQLWDILHRLGLEKISVPPGTEFDPARHEAVGEVPASEPPGTVTKEMSVGYILENKIIRPARVLLSKSLEEK
jgi:molecular chaperone GrpE